MSSFRSLFSWNITKYTGNGHYSYDCVVIAIIIGRLRTVHRPKNSELIIQLIRFKLTEVLQNVSRPSRLAWICALYKFCNNKNNNSNWLRSLSCPFDLSACDGYVPRGFLQVIFVRFCIKELNDTGLLQYYFAVKVSLNKVPFLIQIQIY